MYMMDFRGGLDDEMVFADRSDAGRQLATRLSDGRVVEVVLGVSKGGVPVAFEVAGALHADLDVIVVKKIGAPFSGELALGATCSDGTSFIRYDTTRALSVPREYLDEEVERRAVEALAAEADYRDDAPAVELNGKRVIIVDDGVATGSTIEAAIMSARKRGAAHVTVAVPISSAEAARRLSATADEFIALATPAAFWAVGQFYGDFSQVSAQAVKDLLRRARSPASGRGRVH